MQNDMKSIKSIISKVKQNILELIEGIIFSVSFKIIIHFFEKNMNDIEGKVNEVIEDLENEERNKIYKKDI